MPSEVGIILVISSQSRLAELVHQAMGKFYEVIPARTQQEGLERAQKEFPEVIILGYLEPQGTTFDLHRRLREGWITRNIPLLVVDIETADRSRRALTIEEGLQMEADQYLSLVAEDGKVLSRLAEPIINLRERVGKHLQERINKFKEAVLDPDTFCVTWEQVAGRGAFEMQQEEIIENAMKAARRKKVHAVSVTDNPGGNPAISTEILCTEIKKLGIEPLVHLAFRDKNRNECESLLFGLAALEVRNILMLTGDYPSRNGFKGQSKPVFDLDSVQGLQLIDFMNKGMEHEMAGRHVTLASTDFFAGACVSPFKQYEPELMGQYYKLQKKIEAGAQFIISQLGYDMRKLQEIYIWMKTNGYNVPLMANIYVLPFGAAKAMHANQIPGAVVTDKLLQDIDTERKTEDKGREARYMRAAKMYAVAKGMGFAGAHIGGHGLAYETLEYIIEKGEELSPQWQECMVELDYPQKDGFYLFEKDEKTGLNTDKKAPRQEKSSRPFIVLLSRITHSLIFEPKSPIFKLLRPLARLVDCSPRLKKPFTYFEHLAKVVLFSCMNCGDCALFDVAYLCPVSQCPKNQRNGPCGGSYQGWCEVYPNERLCIWVKAYRRLKAMGKEDEIGNNMVPPCNWELWETSSWLNFYIGRDHLATKVGITEELCREEEKKK
ncbi:methylenetetrahydrofolate reductase C-terminal domain-containing protein [Chloroflexota bacterium]